MWNEFILLWAAGSARNPVIITRKDRFVNRLEEVPASDPGRNTDLSGKGVSWFHSGPPVKLQDSALY